MKESRPNHKDLDQWLHIKEEDQREGKKVLLYKD